MRRGRHAALASSVVIALAASQPRAARARREVHSEAARQQSTAPAARQQRNGDQRTASEGRLRHGQANASGRAAASRAARAARTARIQQAFVASTELRPMAQQLATLRTPAAYAGVTKYAQEHHGEAAAAAYLALGHAYLLDKRYAEAEANLQQARQAGDELADYADFLGAEANHEAGNEAGSGGCCCMGLPSAIRTAFSMRGAGAGGQCAAGDEQCGGRAAGAGCGGERRRRAGRAISLRRGKWRWRMGKTAGGGAGFQAAAAGRIR